ncbi:MAG: hypothetical protein JWO62_1429 [Acidimicrobiaceae bacterium]|nr:hypothetical protein [Acidimicrobiaceae bacterium]
MALPAPKGHVAVHPRDVTGHRVTRSGYGSTHAG